MRSFESCCCNQGCGKKNCNGKEYQYDSTKDSNCPICAFGITSYGPNTSTVGGFREGINEPKAPNNPELDQNQNLWGGSSGPFLNVGDYNDTTPWTKRRYKDNLYAGNICWENWQSIYTHHTPPTNPGSDHYIIDINSWAPCTNSNNDCTRWWCQTEEEIEELGFDPGCSPVGFEWEYPEECEWDKCIHAYPDASITALTGFYQHISPFGILPFSPQCFMDWTDNWDGPLVPKGDCTMHCTEENINCHGIAFVGSLGNYYGSSSLFFDEMSQNIEDGFPFTQSKDPIRMTLPPPPHADKYYEDVGDTYENWKWMRDWVISGGKLVIMGGPFTEKRRTTDEFIYAGIPHVHLAEEDACPSGKCPRDPLRYPWCNEGENRNKGATVESINNWGVVIDHEVFKDDEGNCCWVGWEWVGDPFVPGSTAPPDGYYERVTNCIDGPGLEDDGSTGSIGECDILIRNETFPWKDDHGLTFGTPYVKTAVDWEISDNVYNEYPGPGSISNYTEIYGNLNFNYISGLENTCENIEATAWGGGTSDGIIHATSGAFGNYPLPWGVPGPDEGTTAERIGRTGEYMDVPGGPSGAAKEDIDGADHQRWIQSLLQQFAFYCGSTLEGSTGSEWYRDVSWLKGSLKFSDTGYYSHSACQAGQFAEVGWTGEAGPSWGDPDHGNPPSPDGDRHAKYFHPTRSVLVRPQPVINEIYMKDIIVEGENGPEEISVPVSCCQQTTNDLFLIDEDADPFSFECSHSGGLIPIEEQGGMPLVGSCSNLGSCTVVWKKVGDGAIIVMNDSNVWGATNSQIGKWFHEQRVLNPAAGFTGDSAVYDSMLRSMNNDFWKFVCEDLGENTIGDSEDCDQNYWDYKDVPYNEDNVCLLTAACCLPDGECIDTNKWDCFEKRGRWSIGSLDVDDLEDGPYRQDTPLNPWLPARWTWISGFNSLKSCAPTCDEFSCEPEPKGLCCKVSWDGFWTCHIKSRYHETEEGEEGTVTETGLDLSLNCCVPEDDTAEYHWYPENVCCGLWMNPSPTIRERCCCDIEGGESWPYCDCEIEELCDGCWDPILGEGVYTPLYCNLCSNFNECMCDDMCPDRTCSSVGDPNECEELNLPLGGQIEQSCCRGHCVDDDKNGCNDGCPEGECCGYIKELDACECGDYCECYVTSDCVNGLDENGDEENRCCINNFCIDIGDSRCPCVYFHECQVGDCCDPEFGCITPGTTVDPDGGEVLINCSCSDNVEIMNCAEGDCCRHCHVSGYRSSVFWVEEDCPAGSNESLCTPINEEAPMSEFEDCECRYGFGTEVGDIGAAVGPHIKCQDAYEDLGEEWQLPIDPDTEESPGPCVCCESRVTTEEYGREDNPVWGEDLYEGLADARHPIVQHRCTKECDCAAFGCCPGYCCVAENPEDSNNWNGVVVHSCLTLREEECMSYADQYISIDLDTDLIVDESWRVKTTWMGSGTICKREQEDQYSSCDFIDLEHHDCDIPGSECDPITGACCREFDDGTSNCTINRTKEWCEDDNDGLWLGANSDCNDNPCNLPTGACCMGFYCTDIPEIDCIRAGEGFFQGEETSCEDEDIICGEHLTVECTAGNDPCESYNGFCVDSGYRWGCTGEGEYSGSCCYDTSLYGGIHGLCFPSETSYCIEKTYSWHGHGWTGDSCGAEPCPKPYVSSDPMQEPDVCCLKGDPAPWDPDYEWGEPAGIGCRMLKRSSCSSLRWGSHPYPYGGDENECGTYECSEEEADGEFGACCIEIKQRDALVRCRPCDCTHLSNRCSEDYPCDVENGECCQQRDPHCGTEKETQAGYYSPVCSGEDYECGGYEFGGDILTCDLCSGDAECEDRSHRVGWANCCKEVECEDSSVVLKKCGFCPCEDDGECEDRDIYRYEWDGENYEWVPVFVRTIEMCCYMFGEWLEHWWPSEWDFPDLTEEEYNNPLCMPCPDICTSDSDCPGFSQCCNPPENPEPGGEDNNRCGPCPECTGDHECDGPFLRCCNQHERCERCPSGCSHWNGDEYESGCPEGLCCINRECTECPPPTCCDDSGICDCWEQRCNYNTCECIPKDADVCDDCSNDECCVKILSTHTVYDPCDDTWKYVCKHSCEDPIVCDDGSEVCPGPDFDHDACYGPPTCEGESNTGGYINPCEECCGNAWPNCCCWAHYTQCPGGVPECDCEHVTCGDWCVDDQCDEDLECPANHICSARDGRCIFDNDSINWCGYDDSGPGV